MATLRELEDALLNANEKAKAGDEKAKQQAQVLAAEVMKQRVGPQKFMQFFQGANEEIGNIIPPLGASKWWQENFEGPEPTTAGERIARGAGKGTVDALALAVPEAYLAKAGTLAAPVTAATGTAKRVAKTILDTFRQAPAATAAYEVTAGATAGAGAQIGAETSDSPAAPIIGGVIGGVSPAAIAKIPAVSPTIQVGKRLWQMFANPSVVEQRAKSAVYPGIERAISTPEAQQEFARTQEVSKRLGLGGQTDFTIAQKTGSTQLLRDQMALEAGATGSSLDSLAARKRNVLGVISEKQKAIAPQASGDVAEVAQEAGGKRISELQTSLAAQQELVQADMAAATSKIVPTDKEALGRGIRESLSVSKQATKDRLAQVAKEAGLNEDQVAFEFGGLEQAVADRFSGPDFGNIAPRMVARLKAYAKANKPEPEALDINTYVPPEAGGPQLQFTLRDLQDIRSSVSDDITLTAASAAPDRNRKLRELITLRKTVDDFIDNSAPIANPENPDLAKNWGDFRKQWREEYANVYEKGRVFKVLRTGTRDIYRTSDEMVADSFLSPTGVKQYLAAGGDPKALRSAALDKIAQVAIGPDGVVKQAKLTTWLKVNGQNLPPQVRAELASTEKVVAGLAERQNTLYLREQRVKDSLLNRALGRSGKDPDKFIDAAMRDPALMKQAMKAASESDSLEALRRAVWLRIFPDGNIDIRTIDKAMTDNRRALNELFGYKHLDNISLIRDGLEIEGRTPFPQGAPARPEDFISRVGQQAGTGVPQMASRAFAVASGRTSLRFVLTEMAGRLFTAQSKQAQERVFKEALTNPELARDIHYAMLDKNALKNPELRARLHIWLWNLGIPNTEEVPE